MNCLSWQVCTVTLLCTLKETNGFISLVSCNVGGLRGLPTPGPAAGLDPTQEACGLGGQGQGKLSFRYVNLKLSWLRVPGPLAC